MAPHEFKIDVSKSRIDSIKKRVNEFPWSTFKSATGPNDDEWAYGPPTDYMRSLCNHWLMKYDWPARQSRMNSSSHYYAEIRGHKIHFIHERSTNGKKLPVMLLHGWPYTFHSFHETVQILVHPERYGGLSEDAVDVVVPSMPGYDFSESPSRPVRPTDIAHLYNNLMTEVLGYPKYLAHGGDWGSYISEMLAFHHPDHCVGIHLNMISVRQHGAAPKSGNLPPNASAEEKAYVDDEMKRWASEGAYARLQSTKPTKLGYSMADSPVGVAAWIVEAFHAWADLSSGRSFEELFPFDDLLDEVMLYIVTDSFHTSTWLYVGESEEGSNTLPPGERIDTPTGLMAFPDPVFTMMPIDVARQSHNVVSYTVKDRGGHFPFYEARQELVDDVRKFHAQISSNIN